MLSKKHLRDCRARYYPSKYWALAFPCHLLVSFAAVYVFYLSYVMMNLPPLEDITNIVDPFSETPAEDGAWGQEDRIPPITDLPVTYVNRLLHRPRRPARSVPSSMLPGRGNLHAGRSPSLEVR